MTCFRQTAARRPTGRTAGRTAGEASQVRSARCLRSRTGGRVPPRAPFFSWRSRPCGPARERTGRPAMPFALPLYAPGETILARRGPCNVAIYTRTNTPADGAALSALVESQGGSSWAWDRTWESAAPARRYRGRATFPSLRRAFEARLLSSELVQQVEFALPASARLQLEGLD